MSSHRTTIDDKYNRPKIYDHDKFFIEGLSNTDAPECDILGIQYVTRENVKIKYRFLQDWYNTMLISMEAIGSQHEPPIALVDGELIEVDPVTQLIQFAKELRTAKAQLRAAEQLLQNYDPDTLSYIFQDGGSETPGPDGYSNPDVAREITSQTSIRGGEDTDNAVVSAGPEYYATAQGYTFPKTQHQLDATEAFYENNVLRQPLYRDYDENDFVDHSPMKPLSPNLMAVMTACLPKFDRNQSWPGPGTGDGIMISDLAKKLDKITDFRTGEVIKEAHPVLNVLVDALKILRKRGLVRITKRDEEYHIQPQLSRLALDIATNSIDDDFNIKPTYRAVFQPKVYSRGGKFYPRIGILIGNNPKRPLFMTPTIVEKYTTTAYEDFSLDGRKFKRIVSTGIPFSSSSQLHPEQGMDYDQSRKFSVTNDWSQLLRDIFISRLNDGTVETMTVKEQRGDEIKYKKQAYAIMRLPDDAYPKLPPVVGGRKVLVFCDVFTKFSPNGVYPA